MSRRILAQTLQRSLRASRPTYLVSQQFHIPISSPQIKQLSPVSRFSTCSARFYATEDDSRGVPIQHSENEIKITPEEKERFELQKKAQQKFAAGKFEEAIDLYKTLLARRDLQPFEKRLAFFNIGVGYHQSNLKKTGEKSHDIAMRYWKDAVSIPVVETGSELDKEERALVAAANMNIGSLYVVSKEFETGLKYLQSAAEVTPEDGEVHFNIGVTLIGLGKYEEALKELEAAQDRGIGAAIPAIKEVRKALEEEQQTDDKNKGSRE